MLRYIVFLAFLKLSFGGDCRLPPLPKVYETMFSVNVQMALRSEDGKDGDPQQLLGRSFSLSEKVDEDLMNAEVSIYYSNSFPILF